MGCAYVDGKEHMVDMGVSEKNSAGLWEEAKGGEGDKVGYMVAGVDVNKGLGDIGWDDKDKAY